MVVLAYKQHLVHLPVLLVVVNHYIITNVLIAPKVLLVVLDILVPAQAALQCPQYAQHLQAAPEAAATSPQPLHQLHHQIKKIVINVHQEAVLSIQ